MNVSSNPNHQIELEQNQTQQEILSTNNNNNKNNHNHHNQSDLISKPHSELTIKSASTSSNHQSISTENFSNDLKIHSDQIPIQDDLLTSTDDRELEPKLDSNIIGKSRKRSAEAPPSSTLSSPSSSDSEYRQKRAASEPLQQIFKNSSSSSPVLPHLSPSSSSLSNHLTEIDMVGCLPLEVWVYVASLLNEKELIKLSCTNSKIRKSLIGIPILWSNHLTLEISNPNMTEQIDTLFIQRSLRLPNFDNLPNLSSNTTISRWLNSNLNFNYILKKLIIKLKSPNFSLDERTNRLIIIPEENYWNVSILSHNLKILKSLMLNQFSKLFGLFNLEINLEAHFEHTLLVGREIWNLIQTPWARSVIHYRFAIGFPLARLPPRTLIGLTAWMPSLETLEIEIISNISSTHKKAAQREPKMILGGGHDMIEPSNSNSINTNEKKLKRLSLTGFDLSTLILPIQLRFPKLIELELKNINWNYKSFYQFLFISNQLISLSIWQIEFDLLESDLDELPMDWPFWNTIEEEMNEINDSSDSQQQSTKSITATPMITLNKLKELELGGVTTPLIWTILNETTSSSNNNSTTIINPILKMPNLKKITLEIMVLDEDELSLIELPNLAPLINSFSIRRCSLKDEADLYNCIRCLPYLEMLDLRQTEPITSNLINALALSVPNIIYLDVRGCGWVPVTSVARLAETIRDSSEGIRRITKIGVDLPPLDDWEGWEAWRWLEFTHELIDEEEWKIRRRDKKDKFKESDLLLSPSQIDQQQVLVENSEEGEDDDDDDEISEEEEEEEEEESGESLEDDELINNNHNNKINQSNNDDDDNDSSKIVPQDRHKSRVIIPPPSHPRT
ncbi:hypothetical protein CROQUDRAFT_653339 [Cronartium quercuum f. sp. fusiforme G11]|uniref:F-box domain-containing protein n=1 Tax=Cronartium quercuum f. sp. fusiforme G11 TaxID=708437 RepID=A0A9P6NT53_9BASI|nr:hypothetical protein CROQUDRAFT_653339 [Cronartium quercuum f. sp. fusiforme G11]